METDTGHERLVPSILSAPQHNLSATFLFPEFTPFTSKPFPNVIFPPLIPNTTFDPFISLGCGSRRSQVALLNPRKTDPF
jgi:hypothetical protein